MYAAWTPHQVVTRIMGLAALIRIETLPSDLRSGFPAFHGMIAASDDLQSAIRTGGKKKEIDARARVAETAYCCAERERRRHLDCWKGRLNR